MNDYYGSDDGRRPAGFFARLSPPVRAAVIVSVVMLVLNLITFLTGGAGLALSLPLQLIVYGICGGLAAKFNVDDQGSASHIVAGAISGLVLAGISFLVNVILTLILGAPSLGISLVVGVPYLCLCGPLQVIFGGLLASFGGFVYGLFAGRNGPSSDYSW